MKKTLALFLSMVLIISCFGSMAISSHAADDGSDNPGESAPADTADTADTEAPADTGEGSDTDVPPEDETVALWEGNIAYNMATNPNSGSFGQKFTVPAGKLLTGMHFKFSVPGGWNGNANFALYQWSSDYDTTIADTPLYTVDFLGLNSTINMNLEGNTFDFGGDEFYGELLWVVTPEAATDHILPMGATAKPSNVTNFVSGVADVPCTGWADNDGNKANSIYANMLVVDDPNFDPTTTTPPEEPPVLGDEYPLYAGSTVDNMAVAVDKGHTSFGQQFTVPAGSMATSVSVSFSVYQAPGKGTFILYQWESDYDTTIAGTPLYTEEFVGADYGTTQFILDTPASGELLWVILIGDGSKLVPLGATEGLDGVVNYVDGAVASKNADTGITGWDNANTIRAMITILEDPNYVPPVIDPDDSDAPVDPDDGNTTNPGDDDDAVEAPDDSNDDDKKDPTPDTDDSDKDAGDDESAGDDTTTETPETTATPATTKAPAETEAEDGGCGSVVASAAAVMAVVIAGAAVVIKKKED